MSSSKKDWLQWLDDRLNLTEIFSILSLFALAYGQIDTTKGIRHALKEAFFKPIESYLRWPHILGIIVLLLFLIEVFTGILLAFYYQPTTASAFESVRFIIRDVSFGWLVHNVHRWTAYLLIIILTLRLIRIFYHKVYQQPRELLWVINVFLIFFCIMAAFTGNLLPWDQYSYWSVVRGIEIFIKLPLIKPFIEFFFGSPLITEAALIRFYFFHITLLPLIIFFLLFLHFSGIRKVGLSTLPDEAIVKKPLYPQYFFNMLILFLLIIAVIITLSTLFPIHLHRKADPLNTFIGASPPWYLLWLYGAFETIPFTAAALLIPLSLIIILFYPFIDLFIFKLTNKKIIASILFSLFIIAMLSFSILGYLKK